MILNLFPLEINILNIIFNIYLNDIFLKQPNFINIFLIFIIYFFYIIHY